MQDSAGKPDEPSFYKWYRRFNRFLTTESSWSNEILIKDESGKEPEIPLRIYIVAVPPNGSIYNQINGIVSRDMMLKKWQESKDSIELQLLAARMSFPDVLSKFGPRLKFMFNQDDDINHEAATVIFDDLMNARARLSNSGPSKGSGSCSIL